MQAWETLFQPIICQMLQRQEKRGACYPCKKGIPTQAARYWRIIMHREYAQHEGNAISDHILYAAIDVFAHDAPVVDQTQDEEQQDWQQHRH